MAFRPHLIRNPPYVILSVLSEAEGPGSRTTEAEGNKATNVILPVLSEAEGSGSRTTKAKDLVKNPKNLVRYPTKTNQIA